MQENLTVQSARTGVLTVSVLGTPLRLQHCTHTVSRAAFTALSVSVFTMSAQSTNRSFKIKWSIGHRQYEI